MVAQDLAINFCIWVVIKVGLQEGKQETVSNKECSMNIYLIGSWRTEKVKKKKKKYMCLVTARSNDHPER